MDRHTPQLVYRPLTWTERRRITIAALAVITACALGWFVRTPIENATKAGYGQQAPQVTRMSAPTRGPVSSNQPVNP